MWLALLSSILLPWILILCVKKSNTKEARAKAIRAAEDAEIDKDVATIEALKQKFGLKKNPLDFAGKEGPYASSKLLFCNHICRNPKKDKANVCVAHINSITYCYLGYQEKQKGSRIYREKSSFPPQEVVGMVFEKFAGAFITIIYIHLEIFGKPLVFLSQFGSSTNSNCTTFRFYDFYKYFLVFHFFIQFSPG